jgi:ceramide glucosyltransferase
VLLGTLVLALAQPAARRRGLVDAAPPVTVVIPVKGGEPTFAHALESVLRQLRPQDELIVASAEADGPLLPVARDCFARFPQVRARLHIGAEQVVRSPKMNNMLGPIHAAANDVILSKDANAVLADGQVVELLRHLAPGVGLVTVVTRADAPANAAARIEAAFMNGYHARMLLAASTLGMGFGLGKVMLFDRRAFERAGGAPAMADAVHEDHAMGMVFARAGLRTLIAGREVSQVLGTRTLRSVWDRQLRWAICRRFDEPAAFLLEPAFIAFTTALVALAAGPALGVAGPFLALATLAVWYAVETVFLLLKGWKPISPLAFLAREVMIAAMWLRAWTTTEIVWAGVRMDARRARSGRSVAA